MPRLLLLLGLLAAGGRAWAQAPHPATPIGYRSPYARHSGTAPRMKVRQLAGKAGGVREFAVIFYAGDDVVAGMADFAARYGIRAAHFTAIGAADTVTLGWFDFAKKAYKELPFRQQVEVAALTGDIGFAEGRPAVHMHATIGLPSGEARTGHVLDLVASPTLEVFVTAYEDALPKRWDHDQAIQLFVPDETR